MLTDKFFVIAQAGHEITLWLLILLSILSIAFILERFVFLMKVSNASAAVSQRIRETLQSSKLEEIEEIAKDRGTLEGRALSYGLRHVKERGASGLEEIFNSYALTERPYFEKHLSFLATVGSNAPFIGLLGTVFGIMDAFRTLATSQGDPGAVMVGISKALVATAIGLLVAIPAVIAFNFFQKKVKAAFQSLESVRDLCMAYALTKRGN